MQLHDKIRKYSVSHNPAGGISRGEG